MSLVPLETRMIVSQWLPVVIYGYQWLPVVLSSSQWFSVVLSGYQWFSVVTSGSHVTLGTMITGYRCNFIHILSLYLPVTGNCKHFLVEYHGCFSDYKFSVKTSFQISILSFWKLS